MKISVIVPVHNEEQSVGELLDSLLTQSRKPDEIVITDGGSTDATAQIVESYAGRDIPVRLIRAGFCLPGRGRNLAAAAARYEWIGFIDAGTRPARNWLEALAARAEQDENVDVVYGSWEPIVDTFFKECAAISYLPPAISTNGANLRPRSIVSALMRCDVWRSVNGFPEDLRSAEDLIFMNRVEEARFRIASEPLALVYWNIKPSLGSTFKRFVVYSRYNIRAGLWRQWQAAILSRYLLLITLAVPVFIFGLTWLLLPLSLWFLMLLARAIVSIRRHRRTHPATLGHNLKRLLVLTPLVAVLDAAAIIGAANWLLLDSFRVSRKTVLETGNGA